MIAFLGKYLAVGLGGLLVLALGWGGLQCSAKNEARGERELARQTLATEQAEHSTTRLALVTQRQEAREAVDAANLNAETLRDEKVRCDNALSSLRATADRCRKVLNTCVTPSAVAERWGRIYPARP